ncbi:site-specific integrase [Algibacter sp. AS12]|uniref:tyrosine-type recombinase/integrase n=1 Tax=Algibacter sp. AS12 TaxID=3135773 RepID=UPI00398B7E26
MSKLNNILTFENTNEHVFEHILEHELTLKASYSTPKIYNAKGDLSKRWYVYFSFRNPKTGKLERMKNIYGKANIYKTKEDRLTVLTTYRKRLIILLKKGYNPFEDNTVLYESTLRQNSAQKSEVKKPVLKVEEQIKPIIQEPVLEKTPTEEKESDKMSVKDSFSFSLKIKSKIVAARSLKDYEGKANKLTKWLEVELPAVKTIDQVNKKVINTFLNSILASASSRTYNNYRTDLSSLMQTMEDNEIISTNPVKKIKALKTSPERNKTYSLEKQTEIFNYLKTEDPILLLYIQFISYNLLRPIEVCRLKIKDINLNEKLIQFKAKNSPLKTKRIPDILLKELPDLSQLDGDLYLFTPDKIGGEWNTVENNRRDYFSKRYKKVVKEHFKLDKNYGLYSFRHTFITKLYRALVIDSSPHAAKSQLMIITGHSTMDALEKYLRDIDAAIPEDYSHLLK